MSHKKYRTQTDCLNCGAEVKAKFCPECGQENLETHENFLPVAGHFLSDYFHYDSKFLRSLLPLFVKPGFLTKEYWEGRRVRYIHPLRLYFFITILFMIAATYFYNQLDKKIVTSLVQTTVTLDSVTLKNEPHKIKEIINKEKEKSQQKFSKGIDRFFYQLKYISFLLLPVYALIFQMLYMRRKGFYVDHLVYTLHVQSFSYLLISFAFLIALAIPDHLAIIKRLSILLIFIYITFSLRFLYYEKWWKTILKSFTATLLLVTVMAIVFGIYIFVAFIN